MKKRNGVAAALGALALLTAFGAAGCGDKDEEVGGEGTSGKDALKHMGGPPPGQQGTSGGRGNSPAPPSNQQAPPSPPGPR